MIPASGMARGPTYPVAPEKIIVAAKSLFTCFRITTAHSPTRSAAEGWLTSPTYSPKRVTFTTPTLEGSSAINRTSCWPQALTRPGLRHLSESSAMLPIVTSQTLARLYPLYVLCEISKPLSGCGGRIVPGFRFPADGPI